jgi:hypothetical protein
VLETEICTVVRFVRMRISGSAEMGWEQKEDQNGKKKELFRGTRPGCWSLCQRRAWELDGERAFAPRAHGAKCGVTRKVKGERPDDRPMVLGEGGASLRGYSVPKRL